MKPAAAHFYLFYLSPLWFFGGITGAYLQPRITRLVVGLLAATAWLLLRPGVGTDAPWMFWVVGLVVVGILWKTRVHLLWVMAAGAGLGAMSWI